MAVFCVFTGKLEASCDGKVLLLEQYGNSGKGGNRYTVKIYHASSQPDPNEEGQDAWLHERMTLTSANPDFKPWDVATARKVHVVGEFLFTV
jgi:hypothetical protein